MRTELQNQAWASLPKDFKEGVRNYRKGILGQPFGLAIKDNQVRLNMLNKLFGKHNLTAGEQLQPGDKVRIIQDGTVNPDYVGIVDEIGSIAPQSIRLKNIDSNWVETCLEPYTAFEPKGTESGEKGNNSENSLNLCELLKGRCTVFYSPMWGDTDVIQLYDVNLRIAPCKNHETWLNTDEQGKCDDDGICMLWPSRALYEQYPLNAAKAWNEWQKEQKTYDMHIQIDTTESDCFGEFELCETLHFRTLSDRDKCIEEIKSVIEKYSK